MRKHEIVVGQEYAAGRYQDSPDRVRVIEVGSFNDKVYRGWSTRGQTVTKSGALVLELNRQTGQPRRVVNRAWTETLTCPECQNQPAADFTCQTCHDVVKVIEHPSTDTEVQAKWIETRQVYRLWSEHIAAQQAAAERAAAFDTARRDLIAEFKRHGVDVYFGGSGQVTMWSSDARKLIDLLDAAAAK